MGVCEEMVDQGEVGSWRGGCERMGDERDVGLGIGDGGLDCGGDGVGC